VRLIAPDEVSSFATGTCARTNHRGGAPRARAGLTSVVSRRDARCRESSPKVAAILAEECQRLIDDLQDESLRRVARLNLEGYTGAEIAEQLGCNRRTVVRKLEVIRQTWLGVEAP
jgi:DNA-directed RNA polymerase specialized sigma24 family protein